MTSWTHERTDVTGQTATTKSEVKQIQRVTVEVSFPRAAFLEQKPLEL